MPEFASLIEGYHRFRSGPYRDHKQRYDRLADGQAPPVMVISCCDSRVDPATIFDTVAGQVFALRNVANLVPPYEQAPGLHGASAAIEFGVLGLDVRHIVVLGHGACGGIKAALSGARLGPESGGFVDHWMDIIADARTRVMAQKPVDPAAMLEREAIRVSLGNLRTFPYIAAREAAGVLKLHGALFAIGDGQLQVLDEATGRFEPA
jgi:carbonic anhydrase